MRLSASILFYLYLHLSIVQCDLNPCPARSGCKVPSEAVTIVPNDRSLFVDIQCDTERDTGDLPDALLSNLSISINFTYFIFNRCPLPVNTTYGAILSDRTVRTLRLVSKEPLLDSLSPTLFKGLDTLTTLNLMNCGLKSIPALLFLYTPNLNTLTLSENSLTTLDPDVFEHTPNLVKLALGNNQLVKLTDRMAGLTNLQVLYLYQNRIEKISRELFSSMPKLQIVDLQGNHISSLSDDLLYDVPQLRTLNMFTNNLLSLPNNLLSNQTQLVELDFHDNPNLSELPAGLLHNTPSLLKFSVERCNISHIDATVFDTDKLANLSSLSLSFNKIDNLPSRLFSQLTNLTELDLQSNRLTTINKETFANLRKLEIINLKDNLIGSIDPAAFVYQDKLKKLSLAKNRLTTIDQSLFDYAGSLQNLDLSSNQLSFPDTGPKPFNLPSSMVNLNLAVNRLATIPSTWILEKPFLEKFNLQHNELTFFKGSDFQPTSDLLQLDISFNNITKAYFDLGVINQLVELNGTPDPRLPKPKVILEGNPFVCDCDAGDILSYFDDQVDRNYPFVIEIDNLRCAAPEHLLNQRLPTVPRDLMNCPVDSNCPSPCQCLVHIGRHVAEVDCANMNLTTVPKMAPYSNHVILHMENNFLTDLTNVDLHVWKNLTEIYVPNNRISQLSDFTVPAKLQKLDLRGNRLSVLDETLLEALNVSKSAPEVLLQNNPWNCDNCDNVHLVDFLNSNIDNVGNVSLVLCDGTSRQVYLESICVTPPTLNKTILVSTVVSCFIMAIGLAAAAICYYRYNHEIRVWLYAHKMCLWFVKEKELDKNKRFDAFISFSQEDAEFVASHLMPGLEENEPYYRLCVHHRDWLAGEWIPDQIIRSVQDSRRTIVVLSKNFIKSVWGRLEFKAAHHQALQDRTNRIIILVFGDLPPSSEMDADLKMYVKFNTYLKWGDDWFWQKLRYAMPHCPLRSSIPPPSFRSLSDPRHMRHQVGDPNTMASRLAVLK